MSVVDNIKDHYEHAKKHPSLLGKVGAVAGRILVPGYLAYAGSLIAQVPNEKVRSRLTSLSAAADSAATVGYLDVAQGNWARGLITAGAGRAIGLLTQGIAIVKR